VVLRTPLKTRLAGAGGAAGAVGAFGGGGDVGGGLGAGEVHVPGWPARTATEGRERGTL
jgi:hypothetical protein